VFAGMLSILGHYSGDSQAFGSFPSFGYPSDAYERRRQFS
jgi:hypothetical protein